MVTADRLERLGKVVYIVNLPRPEGQDKIDLNEFLRDHPKIEFDELVKQAKFPWEIKIDQLIVSENKVEAICSVRYFVLTELLHYDELTVRAIIKENLKKKFSLDSQNIKDIQRLWSEEKRGKNKVKQLGNGEFDRDPKDPLANTCYLMKPDGFYFVKKTPDGTVPVSLSNFTAKVTRDVIKDNGAEQTRVFEIVGQSANGKKLPAITIPAEKFFAMNWVGQWGVDAVVSAGMGAKDRVREVIQLVSGGAQKTQIFTHIGWRKIDGKWIYLYSGGAIGGDDISVTPEDTLQHYILPPSGDACQGMRASLELLDIASLEVTIPLWASVWRAATTCLLYPTLILWLYGTTGSYKSTLGALFLSHYGEPFTKDTLPGNWLSTDNSLERLAFLCRDAILLVDDYAPENHPRETATLDKRVNRFVRQIGNRAGRGRLRSDLTARPDFIPNALVISTGEQLPLGVSSVGARILPVLCEREKVDLSKLSKAQDKAHQLLSAMRGYIEWLAPQMDELQKTLLLRFYDLRQKATINGHARLPESAAHLQLGTELGLKYAVSLGVISKEDANKIEQKSWNILLFQI